MDDSAADNPGVSENIVENQVPEYEPVKLIPEGFVVDDDLSSIFLEDFEENKEVWLVDIPVAVDPLKLIGQQLDFHEETSFVIDEQTNEKCVAVPSDGSCNAICLLSSQIDNAKKIVSLNCSGKISININYDVPAIGAMIPDGTSVPLPVGLKSRHPFLGSGFKSSVITMDDASKRDVNLVLHNKKKAATNEHMPTDLIPLKEVPRESLSKMAVKNEVLSPKKTKKRKRESLDGDGNDSAHEYSGDSSVHLSKKHKKDNAEESSFYAKTEFPRSTVSNEVMEISVEETIYIKKSKKDKKRASAMCESELNAAAFPGEASDATSPLQMQKKIKKEHQWSGEGEGLMAVSLLESPKKVKKKKKRESKILSEAGQSGELHTDIVVVGDVPSRTLGSVNDVHKELLDVTCKDGVDVGSGFQVGFHEPKIKKEKSKKRQTLDSMGTEDISLHPDAIHSGIGSKRNEFAERVLHEEQREALQEEGDHVKKKKKDKKRVSNVASDELDGEAWRGEMGVIPETLEQTPKKKMKEEHKLSLKSEDVSDILLVETSLPFELGVETSKKAKKKKKRDSEIGDDVGQSGVISDIVLIAETPDKTYYKEKKIKKEINREMDRSILQVSYEEGNAEERKSKKRQTLDKADVGAFYADLPGHSIILGRKGTEMMETINEELKVPMEASGEIKKKKKKDKKRESEFVRNEVDVLDAEVVVIPDTPEQTPKKKKKMKEELDSSLNAGGMADVLVVEHSLSSEGGDGSSKKAKRKKKRESEYGSGPRPSCLPADIVKLEEFTSELVGKSKKEKWFIDCEPSSVPNCSFKSLTEGKKIKKVHGEAAVDAQLGGENSGVSNILNSDSKKLKRRHTMDVADATAVISDQSRMNLLPGIKIEGKSHHKKRQSLMTEGMGAQLMSPKKEKKIKKESVG